MRRLLLWGLILASAAEATIKNEMPTPHLKAFKIEADAKEAAYPGTYILQSYSDKKELYLTFDDGPDRQITPAVLDILKKEGIRATFFCLGENMKQHPDIAKRVVSEGHLLLSHGYTHRDFRKSSAESVYKEQILRSEKLLKHAGGGGIRMFRPPYGAVTDKQIAFFKERGYRIINWSVDSFDWNRGETQDSVVAKVKRYVHPGAVILMHSGAGNRISPPALVRIIQYLKTEGYAFKRIDALEF